MTARRRILIGLLLLTPMLWAASCEVDWARCDGQLDDAAYWRTTHVGPAWGTSTTVFVGQTSPKCASGTQARRLNSGFITGDTWVSALVAQPQPAHVGGRLSSVRLRIPAATMNDFNHFFDMAWFDNDSGAGSHFDRFGGALFKTQLCVEYQLRTSVCDLGGNLFGCQPIPALQADTWYELRTTVFPPNLGDTITTTLVDAAGTTIQSASYQPTANCRPPHYNDGVSPNAWGPAFASLNQSRQVIIDDYSMVLGRYVP